VEPTGGPPPPVPPADGTVTVTWSLDLQHDPGLCVQFGATHLELVVYDAQGRRVDKVTAPCQEFAVTDPLPEGTYTAEVTLIDPGSNARTVTKTIQDIQVVAGTDEQIAIDFPSSSRL
jgi:hypothetical protein